jgi:phosphoglycolate phosphatase
VATDGVSEAGRPAPNWPRAVLFDLDGTLIDSAPDIAAAVNELLSHSSRGPLTLAEVTSMIGNGVEKLVERAFAATGGALAPAALRREQMAMVDVYANHLTELTMPMPGAIDLLEALHGEGTLLGLVTNKPQRFIETILDHLGMSSLFGAVIGGDAGVAKKPAPDMLLAAMQQLGVEPWDTVMVGDSTSDVEAARAAGVPVVVVHGGYSNVALEQLGADSVIGGLHELAGVLETLKPAA